MAEQESWEELADLTLESKEDGAAAPPTQGAPQPQQSVSPPPAADPSPNGPIEMPEVDIALKQALSGESRTWGESGTCADTAQRGCKAALGRLIGVSSTIIAILRVAWWL